jgi:hypothetical protein
LITTLFNLFGNANTFKFEFNGKKYDLLEGVDTSLIQNATIEDLPKLNKLFDTFYHNVQKVIKDNKWTAREFWENTKLIDKIAKMEDIPL